MTTMTGSESYQSLLEEMKQCQIIACGVFALVKRQFISIFEGSAKHDSISLQTNREVKT